MVLAVSLEAISGIVLLWLSLLSASLPLFFLAPVHQRQRGATRRRRGGRIRSRGTKRKGRRSEVVRHRHVAREISVLIVKKEVQVAKRLSRDVIVQLADIRHRFEHRLLRREE